jgi:ATP adenylyltransferase
MLVPRSREACEGIEVNALGFAGSILVRDRRHLETVRLQGPIAILRAVVEP